MRRRLFWGSVVPLSPPPPHRLLLEAAGYRIVGSNLVHIRSSQSSYNLISKPLHVHCHKMPFGTLKTKEANAILAHSSSYTDQEIRFSDIDVLSISLYTTAGAVKQYIPEGLEVENEPLVTYTLKLVDPRQRRGHLSWPRAIRLSQNRG